MLPSTKVLTMVSPVLFGGLLALSPLPGGGQRHDDDSRQHGDADASAGGDPYTLATDPVTGEPLGPPQKQVILKHEGRELRFATKANAERFRADPEPYLAKVDHQLVAQQAPFYPLTACLVSGERLGEMGEPVDYVFRNRLVRFCCKGCKEKLLKEPAKYLKALDQAVIQKQSAAYPLKKCVVSGEALGGEMGPPVDVVMANRLIRLCCKECKKDLAKDPAGFLMKIGHSKKDQHGADHDDGKQEHDREHDHR